MGSFLMKAPTCIIFFPIQQSLWKDEKMTAFEEASCSSDNSFKKRGAWIFISLLRVVAILSSRPHWADVAYNSLVQMLQWRDLNGRTEAIWSCLSFLKIQVLLSFLLLGFFWLKLALTFCSSVEIFQNGLGHFSTVFYMWIMNLHMIQKYVD